nr:hypothetical protein [Haliscomenobacter sp.]
MIKSNCHWAFLILFSNFLFAQNQNPKAHLLPPNTIIHNNIPYQNDTLKKHLLDIYLPANTSGKCPLLVFIHGGGWLVNDKYADMGYMGNTLVRHPQSGHCHCFDRLPLEHPVRISRPNSGLQPRSILPL